MDTDDLTTKTYNAILGEAEKFHHDLTLQSGLLSYGCRDEAGLIKKSEALIGAIKKSSHQRFESGNYTQK